MQSPINDYTIKESLQGNCNLLDASASDSTFVATIMMEAVEIPMMEEHRVPAPHLVAICQREDTLYSWKHCTLAVVDGKPVGGLISYPGEGYHAMRELTFSLVPKETLDFDPFTMDDETRPGEYYLDSLAVLPEYRGKGIASLLIKRGVDTARLFGLTPILACDPENENAYRLYTKLGFTTEGTMNIFGQEYLRMKGRSKLS